MGWLEITSPPRVPSLFLSASSDEGEEAKRRGRGRGRERGRAFEGWYISNVLLTLENNDEAITGSCQRDIALRSIEKAGERTANPAIEATALSPSIIETRYYTSRKIIVEIFNSHILSHIFYEPIIIKLLILIFYFYSYKSAI